MSVFSQNHYITHQRGPQRLEIYCIYEDNKRQCIATLKLPYSTRDTHNQMEIKSHIFKKDILFKLRVFTYVEKQRYNVPSFIA